MARNVISAKLDIIFKGFSKNRNTSSSSSGQRTASRRQTAVILGVLQGLTTQKMSFAVDELP